MNMTESDKLQITKITPGEITKRFHMPVIDFIDHCTVAGQFEESYSIMACMAMLLQNYPRVIFFSFATFHCAISQKSALNVDNMVSGGK